MRGRSRARGAGETEMELERHMMGGSSPGRRRGEGEDTRRHPPCVRRKRVQGDWSRTRDRAEARKAMRMREKDFDNLFIWGVL